MINFPTLVYKDKGSHQRHGGTYDYKAVEDAEAFDLALTSGWVATLAEIVDPLVASDGSGSSDNAPPTRDELEAMATKLNLKFDGRTSDKKLAAMIDEALKG